MAATHPLAGRTVLVTGADGRIGTATCQHLSALGASVTALSLPPEALLDRYGRDRARLRTFVGREVQIDLTAARTLLGFRAEHLLDIEPAPLPG